MWTFASIFFNLMFLKLILMGSCFQSLILLKKIDTFLLKVQSWASWDKNSKKWSTVQFMNIFCKLLFFFFCSSDTGGWGGRVSVAQFSFGNIIPLLKNSIKIAVNSILINFNLILTAPWAPGSNELYSLGKSKKSS